MGNRFIKLWWANRDCIPSENTATSWGNGAIATHREQSPTFVPSHPVSTDRRKDIHQPESSRTIFEESSPSDPSKPVIADAPKVPPPLHREFENLEHLKEQLHKKQEMLYQKRNEFKHQLNKLEKQGGKIRSKLVNQLSGAAGVITEVGISGDGGKEATQNDMRD